MNFCWIFWLHACTHMFCSQTVGCTQPVSGVCFTEIMTRNETKFLHFFCLRRHLQRRSLTSRGWAGSTVTHSGGRTATMYGFDVVHLHSGRRDKKASNRPVMFQQVSMRRCESVTHVVGSFNFPVACVSKYMYM